MCNPCEYGIVGGDLWHGSTVVRLAQVRGIEVVGFVSKDPLKNFWPLPISWGWVNPGHLLASARWCPTAMWWRSLPRISPGWR